MIVDTVSELCHIPPETPSQHGDLQGHVDAYRCCAKSLIGSALVGFGKSQHAPAESISKRAPSTTRTSLRFRINELRAVWHSVAQNAPSGYSIAHPPGTNCLPRRALAVEQELCQTSSVPRSLTRISLSVITTLKLVLPGFGNETSRWPAVYQPWYRRRLAHVPADHLCATGPTLARPPAGFRRSTNTLCWTTCA